MNLRKLPCLLIILTTTLFSACSGEGEGEGEEGPVIGTTVRVGDVSCVKTCVDSGLDQCKALCDQCWSTCANVISRVDCTGTCRSICDCTPAQVSSCTREGYVCKGGEPDAAIEAACEDFARVADTQCQLYTVSHDGCRRVAAIYGSDAAALYTCQASDIRSWGCDSETWCSYTPSTLGSDLCSSARARCGDCPFSEGFVNSVGLLLKKDWLEVGEACLELDSCADALDCLWGWREAIGPDY